MSAARLAVLCQALAERERGLAEILDALAVELGGEVELLPEAAPPPAPSAPRQARRAPLRERPRENVPVDEVAEARAQRALRRHGIG